MAKGYSSYGRLRGNEAGRIAKPVWVCAARDCEAHHHVKDRPDKCYSCGRTEFDFFQSTAEAKRWAGLRLQEKLGLIRNLRRQVRISLLATAPNGLQVQVAVLVVDHVWEDDSGTHYEDVKARGGIDPLAKLKLQWASAQLGHEITIYSS